MFIGLLISRIKVFYESGVIMSKVNMSKQIDGNHMILASSIIKDRERRIQNRSNVWFLNDRLR